MAKEKRRAPKKTAGTIDYPFLIIAMLILSIGLLMVFSASYASAHYSNDDISSAHYFIKQGGFALFGIAGMIAAIKFGYRRIAALSPAIMVGSIILLIAVLVIGVGLYGERRWINVGFNLQPSEVAKTAVILFFAFLISKNSAKMKTFKYGILPFAIVLGIVGILMILEPHYSGTIIIMCIGISMMFMGGASLKWLGGAAGVLGGVAATAILTSPYAMRRIETLFNDPFTDPQGAGYQSVQALLAIGTGGLFGLGFGNSRQKYLYLPEPHNDFIFAIVCEELGFIGAFIIIVLFALLIWRGYLIAMRASDKLGSMIAAGVTTHLALQIVFNLLVVTGIFPVTGVSLPLFSYGGTALIMQLFEIGLVLSVSSKITAPKAG